MPRLRIRCTFAMPGPTTPNATSITRMDCPPRLSVGANSAMRLFLGVDGGQSSTKAVIGDETRRILGSGVGGPCNHAAAGEGRARLDRSVRASLEAACENPGLDAAAV